jgi:hypothetical protein
MLDISVQEVPDTHVIRASRVDNSTYQILSVLNAMDYDKWYKISIAGFTSRQAHSKIYHVKKKHNMDLSMLMVDGELHVKKFQ